MEQRSGFHISQDNNYCKIYARKFETIFESIYAIFHTTIGNLKIYLPINRSQLVAKNHMKVKF